MDRVDGVGRLKFDFHTRLDVRVGPRSQVILKADLRRRAAVEEPVHGRPPYTKKVATRVVASIEPAGDGKMLYKIVGPL